MIQKIEGERKSLPRYFKRISPKVLEKTNFEFEKGFLVKFKLLNTILSINHFAINVGGKIGHHDHISLKLRFLNVLMVLNLFQQSL